MIFYKASGMASICYSAEVTADTEAYMDGWFYIGLGIFSLIPIVIALIDLVISKKAWLCFLLSIHFSLHLLVCKSDVCSDINSNCRWSNRDFFWQSCLWSQHSRW